MNMEALQCYSSSEDEHSNSDCNRALSHEGKMFDKDSFEKTSLYENRNSACLLNINPEKKCEDFFGLKDNSDDEEAEVKMLAELEDVKLGLLLKDHSLILAKEQYGPTIPVSETTEIKPYHGDKKQTHTLSKGYFRKKDHSDSSVLNCREYKKPRLSYDQVCHRINTSEASTSQSEVTKSLGKNVVHGYHMYSSFCYMNQTVDKVNDYDHCNIRETGIQLPHNDKGIKSIVEEELFFKHPKVHAHIKSNAPCKAPKRTDYQLGYHHSSVTSLQWNKAEYSHLLLSSSSDKILKVWNTLDKTCLQELSVHQEGIRSAVWTLSGTKSYSGSYDMTAHLTNVLTGQIEYTCQHQSYVTSVQVCPDDEEIFLTGSKDIVAAWDSRIQPTSAIMKYKSTCGQILDIVFLPGGRAFLCSSEIVSRDSSDRTLMAWDWRSGALLSNQIYHERYTCPCLRVDPLGQYFIAQTNGNYIAIFSTIHPYKMNKKKRYEGHKVSGYSIGIDISPDSTMVISGDLEGHLYVYDTKSTRLLRKLYCGSSPTTCVAWHPVLFSRVATGTWNGDIKIWQ